MALQPISVIDAVAASGAQDDIDVKNIGLFMFKNRNMRIVLFVIVFLTGAHYGWCADAYPGNIIPRPMHYRALKGHFDLDKKVVVVVDPGNAALKETGALLSEGLHELFGIKLKLLSGDQGLPAAVKRIRLTLKHSVDTLGDEGYRLVADGQAITVSGRNPQGVFYGVQSLIQMVEEKQGRLQIPSAEILDKPRFGWRGFMLDVGRYFYSVEFIKKMIDRMAMYKMNTFHWHLTENNGWRIEIKKYPELTAKGAWRAETQYARGDRGIDKNPHGGFYTQEQVKEVIAYARSRFVTIVPEIEMPGHSLAALAVFPELSCTGGPFSIPGKWGVEKDVFCAGNEKTFQFLEDVLTEVAELFPGKVIHIGGDECPKDRWKACGKCRERIRREGLKDENELQSYFIRRMEQFLLKKHKSIIGWDEILEGGLAPNAMVMSWRGTKGGIEAAKQKHPVVMSPNTYMYLDYYQGEHHLEPYAHDYLLPIEKVYAYEPVPATLSEEEKTYIRGVQANVWSEFIHAPATVEYMTFPRITAVAEVGWSSASKNWNNFSRRVELQLKRYEHWGINYARSIYNVWCTAKIDTASGTAEVSLKAYNYQPEIRYTLDGTAPTAASPLYTQPFKMRLPNTVRTATFRGNKRLGAVNERSFAIIE